MLSKVISSAYSALTLTLLKWRSTSRAGASLFLHRRSADAAVKESKERVRAALKNTGFDFPLKQVVVNLAPADIKKEGSAFDLPIAVGMLIAEGILTQEMVNGYLIVGELALDDGQASAGRSFDGGLCKESGFRGMVMRRITRRRQRSSNP